MQIFNSVYLLKASLFVNLPKRLWINNSDYQDMYDNGWEIEMFNIIGNSISISLDSESDVGDRFGKCPPAINVSGYKTLPSIYSALKQSSRNYLPIHPACKKQCFFLNNKIWVFFNIQCVDLWKYFPLPLFLTVITVSWTSNYGHKKNLHKCKSYSNIFSIAANNIAVLKSVSLNTQPRSASLSLFFFAGCATVLRSAQFTGRTLTYFLSNRHRS